MAVFKVKEPPEAPATLGPIYPLTVWGQCFPCATWLPAAMRARQWGERCREGSRCARMRQALFLALDARLVSQPRLPHPALPTPGHLGGVDQSPSIEQAEAVLVAVAEAHFIGEPISVAVFILKGQGPL